METPRLIEPNVKNYLFDTLYNCHKRKYDIQSWIYNMSIFIIFVVVVGGVLYFCRKRKMTPYEKSEKVRNEQEYIVSKIAEYKMMGEQTKTYSNITGLPTIQ